MSTHVCLAASTLDYQAGGGHFWVYLNWALGLRALGCRVTWLEISHPNNDRQKVVKNRETLTQRLTDYGAADHVAYYVPPSCGDERPVQERLSDEVALSADLLLNLNYVLDQGLVNAFRRSALLDMDPGMLQLCITRRLLNIPQHDLYFTIGETVGDSSLGIPGCGLEWHYTPPCVSLSHWKTADTLQGAAFTTVTHWYTGEWVVHEDGTSYNNEKRESFLEYLELPQIASAPLELAICGADEHDLAVMRRSGWRVRDAHAVTSTPADYMRYVQSSLGEFSCAKPHCMRMQNAWISDRTLCYLASGKPAVVQHTGPSRFLPESAGLFRFRSLREAAQSLERVLSNYETQCREAQSFCEAHFDARRVVARLLERALS